MIDGDIAFNGGVAFGKMNTGFSFSDNERV